MASAVGARRTSGTIFLSTKTTEGAQPAGGIRLRILQIADCYFPQESGLTAAIRTSLRELRAKGHYVTLIAPDYGAATDDTAEDIIRVASHRVHGGHRMMKPGRLLELAPRLRSMGYELLHIHTPFIALHLGRVLARRLDLPVIVSCEAQWPERWHAQASWLPGRWRGRLARGLNRMQCRGADAVVVSSNAMADVLRACGVAAPISVVPPSLVPYRFRGGDGTRFRREHALEPEQPLLLYAGRLGIEKNLDFLIRVLAVVRDTRDDVVLAIAGDGPAERALYDLAKAGGLADNVRFTGALAPAERLDGYRAADCVVCASRTERDGIGLLEAMAGGTPVIAIAAMGTRDVVEPERGAVAARDEVGDFAGKVLALLEDPGRRARLGQDARDTAQGWSASVMAERLLDSYREAVTARDRRFARTAVP